MIKTAVTVMGMFAFCARATEFHVAVSGDDAHSGTRAAPFRTIQRAADLAQPGDCVTVHAGVYRERVNPPRGGVSDDRRIVYQAAPGERVEIAGSEIVKGWEKAQGDTWKVTLQDSFFGAFNPYADLIRGDWFNPKGREHHTGAVYLDGEWLVEAAKLADVLASTNATPLWFGKVEGGTTTLWAQFKGVDPNARTVEINVRQTVFYPDKPGRNYITVRGFTLRHAATPWAPPTAEQIGLIGTHWSKGWIIESNDVAYSVCSGISLGKYGDQYDNTAQSAKGYVGTIERAHAHPIAWTRANIGHHIVRGNRVSHCEQAGIVGSLGCAFSTVTGNVIHDIHVRALFTGAEMAGIKFHGAIDTQIAGNRIFRTNRGLWLDWMAQGTRVSRNLFYDNGTEDVYVEVNHGPFLFDNNLLLSINSLWDRSQGGAYVHNLFAGRIVTQPELKHETPYHPAHGTALAGLTNIKGGDNRFFNNLLVGGGKNDATEKAAVKNANRTEGFGVWVYDNKEFPSFSGGNVFCDGARPYVTESGSLDLPDTNPLLKIVEEGARVSLSVSLDHRMQEMRNAVVTTDSLGTAKISGLRYENPDGTPLRIETDYFGKKRSPASPTAGPFERPGTGPLKLWVW